MKKSVPLTIVCTLALTMALLCANGVSAGGNPPNPPDPETEMLTGPMVQGLIEFKPSDPENLSSPVLFSFYGKCKDQDFAVQNQMFDDVTILGDIDYDQILEYRLNDVEEFLPGKCLPIRSGKDEVVSSDLFVTKVKSYQELEASKIAEVMMVFVVPR